MIKSFAHNKYGSDEKFWDGLWEEYDFSIQQDMAGSPLARWFEKYFDKQGYVLEGGCGPGYIVSHLVASGYKAIGIEYAPEIVNRLKEMSSELPIFRGDVTKLDYPDNYFSGYYSGGVVEHVESGPQPMLREAYRVLCPGGIMLLTVPYLNMSRRIIMLVNNLMLRKATKPGFRLDGQDSIWMNIKGYNEGHPGNSDYHFHEYIMSKKEICCQANAVGFEIVEVSPFSIKYGLRDYAFFRLIQAKVSIKVSENNQVEGLSVSGNDSIRSRLRSFWRKTTTYEQADGSFSVIWVWLMRRCFGNMIMVVCRKPL